MSIKKTLVAFFVIFGLAIEAEVIEIQYEHLPIEKTYSGGNATFVVVIPNSSIVKDVTLYYWLDKFKKYTGQVPSLISSSTLKKEGKLRYSYSVPVPSLASGQYLHYFIKISTVRGITIIPENDGDVNVKDVYTVNVLADTIPPKIILVSPKANEIIRQNSIEIKYAIQDNESGIDLSKTKFMFNGQDKTRGLKKRGNVYVYQVDQLEENFDFKHSIKVQDLSGNKSTSEEFKFTTKADKVDSSPAEILDINEKKDKPWKGKGSFSVSYNANQRLETADSLSLAELEKTSAKAYTFSYNASSGDTKIGLGPLILNNTRTTPGNRPQRFTFSFSKGTFDSKWGDTSANISGYTLSSAIVGGMLSWKTKEKKAKNKWEIKAAGGQTRLGYERLGNTQGLYYANGVGTYVGLTRGFMTIYGAYSVSKDVVDSIKDDQGLIPFQDQAAETGTTLKFNKIGLTYSLKYGLSRKSRIDKFKGKQEGYTWSTKVDYTIPMIDLKTGFGANRTSLNYTGAGGNPDHQRFNANLGRSFLRGKINWNSTGNYGFDNISKEKPQTTFNYGLNNNFTLSLPKWPSLNYSNGLTISKSTGKEEVLTENISQNNTLGAAYPFKLLFKQNINTNLTHTLVKNKQSASNETEDVTIGINANHTITWTSWYNSALSFSRSESSSKNTKEGSVSYSFGINNNFKLFKGKLTETLAINKNMSHSVTGGLFGPTTLNSATYSFSSASAWSILPSVNASLNLSYSPESQKTDTLKLFPASLSINFSFNMTF